MTPQELIQLIENTTFINEVFVYRFIQPRTLQINEQPVSNYTFYVEDGDIYLDHGRAFGTEELRIKAISIHPLEIVLHTKLSNVQFGTWKEIRIKI